MLDQGPCHAFGEAGEGWAEEEEEEAGEEEGRGSQGGVSTWYSREPSGERIQASRERAKLTFRCTMDLIPCFPLWAEEWHEIGAKASESQLEGRAVISPNDLGPLTLTGAWRTEAEL